MVLTKRYRKKVSADIILLPVLIFFISCSQQHPVNDKPENSSLLKDTLSSDTALLDKAKTGKEDDSIFKLFEFKPDNFPYKTYYHKNWWGKYTIRDNALLCGLDSSGRLFLISNLLVSDVKTKHTSVSIQVGDQIWKSSTVIPDNLQHAEAPGTITIQANVYNNPEDSVLISAVSRFKSQPIVLKFNRTNRSVTLSKRDKEGIADCYGLAILIKQRLAIKK